MSTPEPSRRTLRQHAAPALLALRTYWPAMLTIQCLALTLVICYYQIDQTAQFFTTIASWKTQGGLLASALCTLISGGLFPELIKRIFRDPTQKAPGAGELAHQFTMWAIIGIKVDLFYRFQALIFGTGTDALTVLSKVMADQLLFTPLVAMNFVVIWFMLYETQYDVKRLVQQLSFSTLSSNLIFIARRQTAERESG